MYSRTRVGASITSGMVVSKIALKTGCTKRKNTAPVRARMDAWFESSCQYTLPAMT